MQDADKLEEAVKTGEGFQYLGRTEVNAVKNLMKNMGLTAEQAMSVLDVSESDREAIATRLYRIRPI